jgi:hypothetical protein
MKNTHLTAEEKAAIRAIANRENLRDLLILVAGIVSHDVEDYAAAIDAGDMIRKAAVKVAL